MDTLFDRRFRLKQNQSDKNNVDILQELLDESVTLPLPNGYKIIVQGLRNAIRVHRILRNRKLT